jgi:type I restriction-modification system DNA methylase subunit
LLLGEHALKLHQQLVLGSKLRSNATQAGDHFTPREAIALMFDILFHTEDDTLAKPGTVRT